MELIEKAKKANEKLPEESRFDSNCITPGTEFMERLQQAFKHFVKLKLSTDPAWQHCRVILSGHEVCALTKLAFSIDFVNVHNIRNIKNITCMHSRLAT